MLLGDAQGFVPLASVLPGITPFQRWAHASAGTFPSLHAASTSRIPADACSFGPPLDGTGTCWGIGLNYKDHAHDLGETRPTAPASFIKPPTALVGPGGPIRLPLREVTSEVTGEAELAVVIGRTCRDVAIDAVDHVVAGLMPVIDMTAVDILRQNPRFLTRAKSFNTFLVVGPGLKPSTRFTISTAWRCAQLWMTMSWLRTPWPTWPFRPPNWWPRSRGVLPYSRAI
jgi:2-keto-4-pentenoate hydratase/2-oxohepta-3-ene-1,7-dioic acid hydratase in catechol pathway